MAAAAARCLPVVAFLAHASFAYGQAEELPAEKPAQAPAAPVPPPTTVPPPPPAAAVPVEVTVPSFAIGVGGAYARRLGEGAQEVGPKNGYAITADFEWIYARLGGLELSFGGSFGFHRFREEVTVDVDVGGMASRQDVTRSLSFYQFSADQGFAVPLGWFRPFAVVSGGLALGYFSTLEPAYAPGELRTTRPTISGALGIDARTGYGDSRLGVVLGASHMLWAPKLKTISGRELAVFGPRLTVGLNFRQPF
jgi:hypothetical protein